MRRRDHDHRILGIAWFIAVLFFMIGMFAVAFFLTGYVYKIVHLSPSLLLSQIINSLLGLLFTGLIMGFAGRFARARRWIPEMNVFAPIIQALESIAQGDFSIRLDSGFRDNPIVNELATSVNKMALELDQMENMRQEFISNVSHEIQSPLTSIRGFAQALENDQLSAEQRHHYLEIIENESMRLSRITEDLLKLAALQSEHAKFEPRQYRLDQQIRNLVLACEPLWSAKEIEMDISLEDAQITADEDLLSQVWNNLIHNSIKFTPQCGHIGMDLHLRDGHVEFKISDSGIGISAEDLPHVFERFYKADKSRTRSAEGSGLGLSIAKTIVEMHRGSIQAASDDGAGATFTVTLPLQ
jgi:two-component system, OmpR family, phosphate regulon sensor histidine kinase PhoR